MRDSIMEDQDELIIRKLECEELVHTLYSQPTQAIDNYDNFDQTMMGLEVSQTDEAQRFNQAAPQREMHYGASTDNNPYTRICNN